MKIGDLVKYMSRTVLIVALVEDTKWVLGIEAGETTIGRYRLKALKVIDEI
jgi:hypothetical protein